MNKFHAGPSRLQVTEHFLHGHFFNSFIHNIMYFIFKVMKVQSQEIRQTAIIGHDEFHFDNSNLKYKQRIKKKGFFKNFNFYYQLFPMSFSDGCILKFSNSSQRSQHIFDSCFKTYKSKKENPQKLINYFFFSTQKKKYTPKNAFQFRISLSNALTSLENFLHSISIFSTSKPFHIEVFHSSMAVLTKKM